MNNPMHTMMKPFTLHSLRRSLASLCLSALPLCALLASGCAVGPDYHRPATQTPQTYTATALPEHTVAAAVPAGQAQALLPGEPVQAQWWQAFGSPELDKLVAEAIKASPDLQAADAALRAAREHVAAQRGLYWPSVGAQFNPTRQKIASSLSTPAYAEQIMLYSLYTAQFNIGYVPDVFGANRRMVEALSAQVDFQRYARQAAYTSLVSNIVNSAIQEASLRAQMAAAGELVALSARLLDMSQRQYAAGQASLAEVTAQEATLAQAQAAVLPLQQQLDQQHNLLAVLTGHYPSELPAQAFDLDKLRLPVALPVSLPAQLLEQRPDIRSAEAQLQAASAMVGVATAARLPSVTLSANIGGATLQFADLLKGAGSFWTVGANILQPVFAGGQLLHQQRAAEATYAQAAAQYRSTVLSAFQDTADTLQAIHYNAEALRLADVAYQAAQKNLLIVQRQRERGAASQPEVLLAQQQYQQAIMSLVQARAARYSGTVALFQALGGAWWEGASQAGGQP